VGATGHQRQQDLAFFHFQLQGLFLGHASKHTMQNFLVKPLVMCLVSG
jgi:hypothetical protein